MNEENEFIEFINTSVSFNPNYNDLKSSINEENFLKSTVTTKVQKKYIKKVFYTLVICLISICTTGIIKDNIDSDIINQSLNYNKESDKYLKKIFDNFIAFGSSSSQNALNIDVIINSNIIDQNDKDVLIDYMNKHRNNKKCSLYFGERNGIDIVHIILIDKVKKTFTFNSNLDYSFQEVLNELKQTSNEIITEDFLYSSNIDEILKHEKSGIIISFREENNIYIPYYMIELKEKIYVINK